MGKSKNTKKHPGWTGNTDPAKYGIDVNAPFKSTPTGRFNVNTMKQAKRIDFFKKDNDNPV
tara:strand:+ start:1724 stop:1906 length:183 start_codon:yes stop_codon:yes gene_type:complete